MGMKLHSPIFYTYTFICEKSFLLTSNYSIIELNLQPLLEAAMPRMVNCNACRPRDFYEITFHKEINFLLQSDAIRLPSGNLMVNSYGYLACCFAKCLRILEDESCPDKILIAEIWRAIEKTAPWGCWRFPGGSPGTPCSHSAPAWPKGNYSSDSLCQHSPALVTVFFPPASPKALPWIDSSLNCSCRIQHRIV